MMSLFTTLEETLMNSAKHLPLELSSFLGGIIEEIIAPIPSPFVMAAVGSVAFAQNKGFMTLLWLSLSGLFGENPGSLGDLLYL